MIIQIGDLVEYDFDGDYGLGVISKLYENKLFSVKWSITRNFENNEATSGGYPIDCFEDKSWGWRIIS